MFISGNGTDVTRNFKNALGGGNICITFSRDVIKTTVIKSNSFFKRIPNIRNKILSLLKSLT